MSDVHLGEGLEVGLRRAAIVVGPEPERLARPHAERRRSGDVGRERVADEERALRARRRAPRGRARRSPDAGFRTPDLGGEDARRRGAPRSPSCVEIAMQERPAGRSAFETRPSLSPRLAQRLEQRVRRRRELMRGPPRRVLRVEEAVELVVVDRDPDVASSRAITAPVLDLLERRRARRAAAGTSRNRSVSPATGSRPIAPQPGRMPGVEQVAAPTSQCTSVSPQSKRTASSTAR